MTNDECGAGPLNIKHAKSYKATYWSFRIFPLLPLELLSYLVASSSRNSLNANWPSISLRKKRNTPFTHMHNFTIIFQLKKHLMILSTFFKLTFSPSLPCLPCSPMMPSKPYSHEGGYETFLDYDSRHSIASEHVLTQHVSSTHTGSRKSWRPCGSSGSLKSWRASTSLLSLFTWRSGRPLYTNTTRHRTELLINQYSYPQSTGTMHLTRSPMKPGSPFSPRPALAPWRQ